MEKVYTSTDIDIAKELGALSKVIHNMNLKLESFKIQCSIVNNGQGHGQGPKKLSEKITGALKNGKPAYGT